MAISFAAGSSGGNSPTLTLSLPPAVTPTATPTGTPTPLIVILHQKATQQDYDTIKTQVLKEDATILEEFIEATTSFFGFYALLFPQTITELDDNVLVETIAEDLEWDEGPFADPTTDDDDLPLSARDEIRDLQGGTTGNLTARAAPNLALATSQTLFGTQALDFHLSWINSLWAKTQLVGQG